MAVYAAVSEISFMPETITSLEVVEALTDEGQELINRQLSEGLAFQLTHFSVGTGGVDWSVLPPVATQIDTSDTELEEQIFMDELDLPVERPNENSLSIYFRIANTEALGFLGEAGVWATITESPYPGEVGQRILFAISHFPPRPKTSRSVFSERMLIQL